MKSITRALQHRNYRLFFSGQSISLIGTWLTRVATSWLVYRLSHSAMILGLTGFAGSCPTFFFAPMAGVLVDRWNRHHVLVVTQTLAAIQSGLLAYFTLRGTITVTHVVLLQLFQGFINSFDMPARQSFVVEMIEDKRDLSNAIALNSSMVNMARLVGPSCAGILIALYGEGGCFTIDALSYVAVIASLLLMKLQKRQVIRKSEKHILHEMAEGLRYVWSFLSIRAVLLMLALMSFMGMPYMVLMPIIVTEKLHGGAALLGYLTAASGCGALVGVLYLASRKSVLGLGKILVLSGTIFGVSLALFSLSSRPVLSLCLMFTTGMGMMVHMASGNTVIQTLVDEDKRGRVMSFYTMAVAGMVPFGSLLGGIVADHIGPTPTLAMGGGICVIGAMYFMRRLPKMRQEVQPIYERLGIMGDLVDS
jgi:MFS family permease